MAFEFKKLSDVEVVAEPSESANVLIEENGVIKKAPKTAVGGAGGGGSDNMVIFTVNPEDQSVTCNKSYNECKKLIEERTIQPIITVEMNGMIIIEYISMIQMAPEEGIVFMAESGGISFTADGSIILG